MTFFKSTNDKVDDMSTGGDTDLHTHNTEGVTYPGHDHIDTLQDLISHIWSPGACASGFALTDLTDGTVGIATGSAVVRVDTSKHGNLVAIQPAAVSPLSLTDDATNYIYADYNGGSPQIGVTTSLSLIIGDGTRALIWAVNRRGTVLNIVDIRSYNVDYQRENAVKDYLVNGIQHANGCEISDLGNMDFAITAGTFYLLNKDYAMPAFDSSTTSFEYVWRSGASPGPYTWNYTSTATGISNDLYNDLTTGTLEAAGNNKFTADNVYAVLNTPGHYKVVYGTQQYDTFAEAQAAPPPAVLPPDLDALSTAVFIGKIIIQVGDTANFSEIQSAFDTQLPLARASSHADLAGLFLAQSGQTYGHIDDQAQTIAGQKGFTSNIIVPSVSGGGMYVDPSAPTYGWRDIIGQLQDRTGGAAGPTWATYRTSGAGHVVKAWQFPTATGEKEMSVDFHIPHDWVPGTDIYIHVHWSQTTVDTGGAGGVPGEAKWYFDMSYADGHGTPGGAADPFSDPIETSVVQQGSTTQYGHMIAETVITDGGVSLFDESSIQVDGLIMVRMHRDSSDAADTLDQSPWVHFIDLHYQSTNAATKNRAPNFYTT